MLKMSSRTLLIATIIASITVPLVLYQPVMASEVNETEAVEDLMERNVVVKPRLRSRPILRLLKHAEPTYLEGEVVALVRNTLVLEVEGEPVRVLMPPIWTTMNGEVVESEVLVDSMKDQTIIVKALEASFENSQGVTISFILGYEINADEDFHAILPFNIGIEEN